MFGENHTFSKHGSMLDGGTLNMHLPPSSLSLDAQKRAARQKSRAFRRLLPIYLFILPGMLLFLIWTLYPLLYAFVMSFFDWNPNPDATSPFVGLANYTRAFTDPIFWQAFRNVIYYTVVT